MMTPADIKIVKQKAQQLAQTFVVADLQAQIKALQDQTLQSDFWQNPDAKQQMQKLGNLEQDLAWAQELQDLLSELETGEFLLSQEGEQEAYLASWRESSQKLAALVSKLELRKFLAGKYDRLGALLSVHSGQGGTEAMDWASMLARAYTRYFERKQWPFRVVSESRGEEAGIKAITFEVNGDFGYGFLKNEAGTHRLVRQSPFNADSLRQTSFALVEVLPLISEADKNINLSEADLSWHFSRAGGAGGQNVNKVNTAVELTYLPLNLVVKCRQERSQEQNKQRAVQILKAKLVLMQEQEQAATIKDLKGDKIQASWGTQIRNYVLHPYQLVKDLRSGVETSDTAGVLDGDLDQFVQAIHLRESAGGVSS